jgi:hypothetical protein
MQIAEAVRGGMDMNVGVQEASESNASVQLAGKKRKRPPCMQKRKGSRAPSLAPRSNGTDPRLFGRHHHVAPHCHAVHAQ